jgi:hypothetical protein
MLKGTTTMTNSYRIKEVLVTTVLVRLLLICTLMCASCQKYFYIKL